MKGIILAQALPVPTPAAPIKMAVIMIAKLAYITAISSECI